MDADAAMNKELAGQYGVASYPTIKFFPRGGKAVEDYHGARSEEAFVAYLNDKCGTHRAVGGGLNDQVFYTSGLFISLTFLLAGWTSGGAGCSCEKILDRHG